MKEYYTMTIAGLERDLPLCPVSDTLYIGICILSRVNANDFTLHI